MHMTQMHNRPSLSLSSF